MCAWVVQGSVWHKACRVLLVKHPFGSKGLRHAWDKIIRLYSIFLYCSPSVRSISASKVPIVLTVPSLFWCERTGFIFWERNQGMLTQKEQRRTLLFELLFLSLRNHFNFFILLDFVEPRGEMSYNISLVSIFQREQQTEISVYNSNVKSIFQHKWFRERLSYIPAGYWAAVSERELFFPLLKCK